MWCTISFVQSFHLFLHCDRVEHENHLRHPLPDSLIIIKNQIIRKKCFYKSIYCLSLPLGMTPGSIKVAKKKFEITKTVMTPCMITIEKWYALCRYWALFGSKIEIKIGFQIKRGKKCFARKKFKTYGNMKNRAVAVRSKSQAKVAGMNLVFDLQLPIFDTYRNRSKSCSLHSHRISRRLGPKRDQW